MTSAKDTQTPTDSAGGTASPRKRALLRWLSVVGVCSGLFAGMWFVSSRFRPHDAPHDEHEPEHAEVTPAQAKKKLEISGSPTEVLTRGDQALASHRFAQALNHFAEFLTAQPNDAGIISYRIGLCNESLGRIELAIAAYRNTIGSTSSPSLSFAGHLGISRCLLRNHRAAEARQLLVPFLLDETRQEKWPALMTSEARYLVALSFGREANHGSDRQIVDDEPAPSSLVPLDIPFYFDEIAAPKAAAAPAIHQDPHQPVPAHPAKPNLKESAHTESTAASDVIDRLAKQANLKTHWSDAAKKAVADRTITIVLKNPNSLELAEMIADSHGLCCRVDDGTMHITTRAEADVHLRHAFHHRLADRALRAAIIADPAHALLPAAYLDLGNLDFEAAHWTDAAAWFDRLTREVPASPYVVVAYTNLARLRLHKAEYAEARRDFFRAIDEAPGHELALQAYARIGQLDLENNTPKDAIQILSRTQMLAAHSKVQPLLSLVLAAAYLEKGEPEKTRLVLLKSSARLRQPPYKSDALLLDAFAQLRLAQKNRSSRRESSELLSALLADVDTSVLGAYGQSIMATAYREMGLADQAERMYRLSAKNAKGPLAMNVQLALAEILLQQNRSADALPILTKIAESKSPARARARLHLAEIDFHESRFQQSSDRCRELWPEHGDVESARILQLWGSSLERLGDFASASKCYAGEAPQSLASQER